MSCLRKRMLPFIAAALLLGAALPAAAQGGAPADPSGAPSAKSLYTGAQKLFDKGSYAEALVAFRQAYNASSSPNARLMIGQCLIGLGKSADAYEEMIAARDEAEKRTAAEPRYAATRDAAAAQVALLEPRVAKVVVRVPEGAQVDVTINGARVSAERLAKPIAVDPGAVVISATRVDGRVAHGERTMKAGDAETVTLTFPEGPAKVVAPPPPPDTAPPPRLPPPEAPRSFGVVRAAGIGVAGIGVAGMAVFAIAGGLAQSKYRQLEEDCGGQRCSDPASANVIDSGKTLAAVSTVGLVAGLAGLTGGGAMILFGGAPSPPRAGAAGTTAAPSPRGALVVAPAGAGLRCTVTF